MANKFGPFTVKIDHAKLRRDVEREVKRISDEGIGKFSGSDVKFVGDEVLELMRDEISKGISPIQGWGRFPAYKAASRPPGKNGRRTGYPYSVMRKYPAKRVRPVNLFLSGKFLNIGLEMRKIARGLSIGIWKEPYASMEDGHRTGGIKGVNDQPRRPIIPQGSETFTRVIYQRLVDSVRRRLERRFQEAARRK